LGYGKEDRSWTLASQFEEDDPPVQDFYKKHPFKPRAAVTPLRLSSPLLATSTLNNDLTVKTAPPLKNIILDKGKEKDIKSWFLKSTGEGNKENREETKRGAEVDGAREPLKRVHSFVVEIQSPVKGNSSLKKIAKNVSSKPKALVNVPAGNGKQKRRKKKSESDESDFVLEEAKSGDESTGSEADDSDEKSVEEDEAMDVSADGESAACHNAVLAERNIEARKPKKNPGWNRKSQGTKKPMADM